MAPQNDHSPWLASFVISSLTRLLNDDNRSRSSDFDLDYHDRDGTLTMRRRVPWSPLVRIVDFPQLNTSSQRGCERGTVSDGGHTIRALFSKVAVSTLSLLEGEDAIVAGRTGHFKLSDPVLRLLHNFEPPRLELFLDNLEFVGHQHMRESSQPAHGLVDRDPAITRILTRYATDSRLKGVIDAQPPSSPPSIRSQHVQSPDRHDRPVDEPDTQCLFLTQAPIKSPAPVNSSTGSAMLDTENQRLLELLRQSKGSVKTLRDSEASICPKNKSADVVEDLVADTTTHATITSGQLPSDSNRLRTALLPSRIERPDLATIPKQSISDGLESFQTANAGPVCSKLTTDRLQSAKSRSEGGVQCGMVRAPPLLLVPDLKRLRRGGKNGRYIPRYLQNIPEDQLELLESEDSWQPPLVGRTSRPGNVPLALFEKLIEAADNLPNPLSRLSSPFVAGSATSKQIPLPTISQHQLDRHSSREDSDSDSSPVSDWSLSPATQKRRTYLPPDSDALGSPEPNMPFNEDTTYDNGKCGKESLTNESSPARFEIRCHGSDRLDREQRLLQTLEGSPEPDCPTLVGFSGQEHHPQSELLPSAQDGLGGSLTAARNDSDVPKAAHGPTRKSVQVERTPYAGKIPDSRTTVQAARPSPTKDLDTDDAAPMSSNFVPGTFDELTSANVPVTNPTAPRPRCEEARADSAAMPASMPNASDPGELGLTIGEPDEPQALLPRRETNNSDLVARASETSQSFHEGRPPFQVLGGSKKLPGLICNTSFIPLESVARRESPEPPVDSLADLVPDAPETCSGSKRRLSVGAASGPQKKQRRKAPVHKQGTEGTSDHAYDKLYEDLRAYRREQYETFRKPDNVRHQSSSKSPSIQDDDVGGIQTPPPKRSRIGDRSMRDTPAESSTPLTQLSVISKNDAHLKGGRQRSVSPLTLVPSTLNFPALLREFQTSYPDYTGELNDFMLALTTLKKMVENGRAPHPFLFDDTVFHHHHSYRPFLLEEVLRGCEPLSYDRFYNTRIERPSHIRGIITGTMLTSLPRDAHASTSESGQSLTVQHPDVSRKGTEFIETRSPAVESHCAQIEQLPATISEHSTAIWVEQQEEQLRVHCRAASPELGTPGIDRSRTEAPVANALVHSSSSPQSETQRERAHAPPQGSGSVAGPNEASRHKYLKQEIVSRSLAMSLIPSTPSVSPTSGLATRPIAQKASPSTRSSSKRRKSKRIPQWPSHVVPATREWWKDEDTPFKRFEKQYDALPSDRTHKSGNKVQGAGKAAGIDIFKWRDRSVPGH